MKCKFIFSNVDQNMRLPVPDVEYVEKKNHFLMFFSENPLTKRYSCDIINKLSRNSVSFDHMEKSRSWSSAHDWKSCNR